MKWWQKALIYLGERALEWAGEELKKKKTTKPK